MVNVLNRACDAAWRCFLWPVHLLNRIYYRFGVWLYHKSPVYREVLFLRGGQFKSLQGLFGVVLFWGHNPTKFFWCRREPFGGKYIKYVLTVCGFDMSLCVRGAA